MKSFLQFLMEMSRAEQSTCRSLTTNIIAHKMKIDHAPIQIKHWHREVDGFQSELHKEISGHRHLIPKFQKIIDQAHQLAHKQITKDFKEKYPNHVWPHVTYPRHEVLLPETEALFKANKQKP